MIEKEYIDIIQNLQDKISSPILLDEPMKKHTSFKIGGPADIFVTAKTIEEIQCVLKISKEQNIPLHIIGNGTNLLVKDGGIRGIVLKTDLRQVEFIEKEEYTEIHVDSGFSLIALAIKALEHSLTGLEFASGIPGTIGGAIRMNAGAYGSEMKEVVIATTYMDKEGNIHTINLEQHEFTYRNSIFSSKDWIILKSVLRLENGSKAEIQKKMEENKKNRQSKQPITMPNAGSTFKRQVGVVTAELIDKAGLKGFCIGDAEVSTLHAGFIVNKGNATANDVIQLIEHIKKTILEKYKIEIETEIEIIGE